MITMEAQEFNDTLDNVSLKTDGGMPCDTGALVDFQFYTWGILANIVTVYGVIGNMLSIQVLRHRLMKSSTSYYLISLAIYDTGVLLSMCLFLALPTVYIARKHLEEYYYAYQYMHPFCYPIALIAQTGTIYTTVAFTLERYVAVCHPLKAANTCTRSRTKRAILLIFVCSVVYNIPRFLESKTIEIWSPNHNKTLPRIIPTELGQNETFKQVYFIYLHLFTMFLFPFSLLAVLNIQLIRAVRSARMVRNKLSATASKEANLTVMLIAVVMVFLVCQLPSIADNILFVIFDSHVLHCSVHYIQFTTLSNLMVVFNSAINFVLYCMFGKRFRRVFIKLFVPCRKNKNNYTYVMYDSTNSRRNGGGKVYDTESTFV